MRHWKWHSVGRLVCALAIFVTASFSADGAPSQASESGILFVNAGATGSNNGTSWENAYRSLQHALEHIVKLDPSVTQVWVANGTYMPDGGYMPVGGVHVPGTGDRTAAFGLPNGVALYGGFAGGETELTQRDIEANETILSGDLAGDDSPYPCEVDLPDCANYGSFCGEDGACFARENVAENSYNVVRSEFVTNEQVRRLDGFTITAGNANGGGFYGMGSGMSCGGQPNIANCTFRGNGYPEALVVEISGRPVVTSCLFQGNAGSGIAADSHSAPTVVDSVFDRNGQYGLRNYDEAFTRATRCVFSRNRRGGIRDLFFGSTWADGCIIRDNYGPGVVISESWTHLHNCWLLGNKGGGIHSEFESKITATNCVFSGNSTQGNGGAIYMLRPCESTVTNCTFSGNNAVGIAGAIFAENRNYFAGCKWTVDVINSAFFNSADTSGSGDEGQIQVATGSTIVVNYSVLPGGWSGPGGVGVIDADPMFVDPLGPDGIPGTFDDNLRLMRGSPGIDTGSSTAIPIDVLTDLDGHARVLCGAVDMGAYESGIGDADCNDAIDLLDAAGLQDCFGAVEESRSFGLPAVCVPFDFDADGQVDLTDYAAFTSILAGPG